MGTFRPTSFFTSVISKAMLLLAFAFSGNVVYSQIALRGTATTAISTSASVTVDKPTGVVAGDIMIANIGNHINATQSSATSAGWTLIAGTDVDRGRATLLYKIAGSSEPASYTFTVTASSSAATGAIVAFSGVNTTTPFDVTAPTAWTTATNTTINNLPSITTVNAGAAVLVFGASSRITSTTAANFTSWTLTNPTLTEIFDVGHNNVNNRVAVGGAWGIRTTAGSTGAGGFTCTPNTNPRTMGGIMIALRPCVTNTAGTASSNPTLCINTALTNITRATTGATGIGTPTGLPAGVTPSWASNVLTISGTPTESGTFNYSIPLTGGCGSVNATGTITVTAAPNAGTLSGTQNICPNGTTTFTTSGTAGGAWSSNATGTATVNSSTGVITGIAAGTATITYTVTGTGGCSNATATRTVTVLNGTIDYANLQFPGSQTICVGTNLTAFGRIFEAGVTEAAGVNAIIEAQIGYDATNTNPNTWAAGNWTNATYNVQSGNNDEYVGSFGSALAAGTYYYAFRYRMNGCAWQYGGFSGTGGGFYNGSTNNNGVLTISPNNTPGTASSNPTLCINTPLTNITRTTTGATGIGAATGLPAGVTPVFASNTITISGTPTASGTFNYSIPLTGGCGSVNATGTITVTPANTISLTSAVGSNSQLSCINAPITNITYATTGATGATFSGLPPNVSGSWAAGVATISGTPTAFGVYNYTVTLTGGCGSVTATGSINVNGLDYANLQFPASANICAGNTFTAFGRVYELGITEAAGANANISVQYGYNNSNTDPSTWPAGNWSAASYNLQAGNNDEYTATGVALGAGTWYYTFRYSINGCSWQYGGFSAGGGGFWNGTTNVSGVVTVAPAPNAGTVSGTQGICVGGTTTFSSNGNTGGAWSTSNAAIATVNSSTGVVTGVAAGTATITYTVTATSPCSTNATATRTVTVTAAANAGTLSGTQNVCIGATTAFTSNGNTGGAWTSNNTGVATVNGSTGVITGVATGSATITYTVTGTGGCANATSTRTVNVVALPAAPTGTGDSRCGTGTEVLSATGAAGTTIDWYAAATGGSPLTGGTGTTTFTTPSISTTTTYFAAARNTTTGCSSATRTAVVATVLPVPTAVTASASPSAICPGAAISLTSSATSNSQTPYTMLSESFNAANAAWTTVNTSTGGTIAAAAWSYRPTGYTNPGGTTYTPGSGFILADSETQAGSTTNVTLTSPAFSTVGVAAANIALNHFYNDNNSDNAFVEASIDGTNWIQLVVYNSDQGAGNAFSNATIALTAACLNQPVVYIRFRYSATNDRYWAINDVTVTAANTNPVFSWTSTPAGYTSDVQNPTGVTPSVSSTYTVTATNNFGCSTSATTGTVTVTPAPAAPTSAGNSRCGAGTVALSATTAAGTTVDWFANPTGGSPLAGGTGTLNYTTPSISTTTIYYAEARNTTTGCRSTTRTAVTATINQTPAITSPFTGKGCSGFAFSATPTNVDDGVVPAGTTYTWSAPTGTGFTGGSAQSTPQSTISQTLTLTGATAAVASYTVTPSVGGCIGATFTANITINPNPTVAITADYCTVGGSAVLTATAGLSNYTWSTGSTGATVNVQQAGLYTVTASNALGCSNTASIGVATELVTNGNFSAGNSGFLTGYTFVADGPGNSELVPEGNYSVASNANNLHSAFFGTGFGGSGNFMIINGSPTITTIWGQNNIAVQPNTTYYFSAWGLTLVNGNNAALQFSINGSQVGSIAYLPNGTTSAPYPWTRFYGQWDSGNNTSVNLEIVNLQLGLSGNDFGLDNISFGTFAPVGLAVTPGANGSSAVCQGSQFFLNANAVGGASPYSFAWTGPNGFTSTLENPSVTNNATAAINGTYNVTITDGLGCVRNGSTTVSVSSLPTALTPSAQNATVCAGVATNINIPTTQEDVGYTLYNSATNQPVSATLPGNLGTLSLSTGALNSTTTFYVVAQRYATGCSRTLTPNVTVTVATTPVLVTNNIALCNGTADLTAAAVTAGSTGGGTLTYWTDAAATAAVANAASVTAGTYYIKATVGSCEDIEPVSVVISGTPITTFNYTGSPFCSNSVNPAPVFSGGGSAGVFTASPAGLAFVSASTGVINLAASAAGTYTVTNTITPVGACTASSTSRTITITAAPNPTFSYASNGFCQAVGANNPVPVFDNGAEAGTFSTSALSGFSFVSTATGEVDLAASTPGSYAIINTIAATAGCASVADTVFVDINPYTFTSAINVSSSDDQLCLGETVDFFASGTTYNTVLERETFNGTFTPWTATNLSTGGTPADARWRLRQSPYNWAGNDHTSNDASQFYISNSEDQGTGGTTNTNLKSPVLNTIGFTTLELSFWHYYNDNNASGDDFGRVQVSTNNVTWTTLSGGEYNSDQGGRTNFVNAVFNLNAYVGLPTLWVRFQYNATNDRAWAIDNVTISGQSTRYTYDWSSVPIAFNSTEQNPADYEPTASAYYDVEALNVYGCTSNTSPIPIIVNPLPEDNAGVDLSICSNTSGAIGLASQDGRTYSWSPATGLSSSTIANPTATTATSAVYTLTETITATGCTDTNNVYVNIRPVSVINNMSASICSGSAFTTAPVNGTNGTVLNGTTYVWNAPSGSGFTGGSAQTVAQNSVSQTLSATGNTAATATYAVTPQVNGCDGAQFNVEVAVSPQANAGTINGAGSVCVDVNSSTLSVSGSVGNLQWQSSSNNVSFSNINGETGSSYTANNLSNTTFYRVVAGGGVCPTVNGSSAQISMLSRPTASISGSAEICAGNSSSLSIALTGNGPWNGTLSNGQSFSSTSSPAVVSVTPGTNSTYTISTLDDSNCAAIGGLNGSATVNVNALPTASITGSSVVCGGSAGNVTINGPANGAVVYTLNGNSQEATLNGSGTAVINTGNVYQNLTYSLVEVEDALCENTATGSATITYQEAPDATISGSAQLCSGQSTTIAFNGNANAVVTYNVNGGAAQNVTLNGSGNASVNTGALSANTTYNLVSVAVGSCSSTIGTSAVVSVGLTIYYQDNDGDGYGNAAVSTVACTQPAGYVTIAGDCCDSNANISPVCEWWADMDGDGYGSFIYEVGCISGVSCSSATWPAQLIPYCALANGGAAYVNDCNDNSVAIHPGATEVCNNTIDDDCDGFVGEACSGQVFDQWATAQLLNVNNTNAYFPNCQTFAGTMVNTDVSPQANPANVAVGGGRDVWYRFVAPTTGVRIQVTASGFNPVIELRTAAHPAGQVDVENANSAVGGTEVLNFGNLVVGQTYYVGVRNFDATNAGTYTMCVSPLRASGCASTPPAGGFTLCSSYKVLYTAATSYTLNFNGVGGTAAGLNSSVVSATGVVTLNNTSLALRYGGVYNVRIDANYMLTNGLGQPDGMITVLGNSVPANCQNIPFAAQPLMQVRSTQVCPAILSRTGSITADPASGSASVCGAVNYTFEFTRVSDCLGTSVIGSPFTINSVGSTASVTLSSAFPAQLPSVGYWSVRVRPNFVNGVSGNWGPSRIIAINGSAASQMLDSNQSNQQVRTFEQQPLSSVYPNPNSGNQVRIDLTDIGSGELSVKIMDGVGRMIYSKQFTVEGSLSTQLDFTEKLTAGIYLVEFTINGETMNERMVVER